MAISKPDVYAKSLGLEFTVETPAQSTMAVLRFTFKFPDMAAEPLLYMETVGKVTKWTKRVKRWTFVTPGPLPIVAANLTEGNAAKVAMVNKKTRKLLKAFWSDEAQARRVAMSQPTPQMSLKVLEDTPMKEKETRQLHATLTASLKILAGPGPLDARGLPSPTQFDYQSAPPEPATPVFGDGQGTGSVH